MAPLVRVLPHSSLCVLALQLPAPSFQACFLLARPILLASPLLTSVPATSRIRMLHCVPFASRTRFETITHVSNPPTGRKHGLKIVTFCRTSPPPRRTSVPRAHPYFPSLGTLTSNSTAWVRHYTTTTPQEDLFASPPSTPFSDPPSPSNADSPTTNKELYRKGLEPDADHTQEGRVTRVAAKLLFDDLRRPHEWYPLARRMKRRIIMHVGPTNSGKTHAALERLKRASSGVYCAPLRLLAEQVFEKMNEDGVACNLVTGEKIIELDNLNEKERRLLSEGGDEAMAMLYAARRREMGEEGDIGDDVGDDMEDTETDSEISFPIGKSLESSLAPREGGNSEASNRKPHRLSSASQHGANSYGVSHVSCTVEMSDVRREVEVALIDEYQLISDEGRGWAWTRALLGIPAKEIHLCGDTSGIDLVRTLLQPTGDELEVHYYERLSPLEVSKKSLLRGRGGFGRGGGAFFGNSRSGAFGGQRSSESPDDWIRELRSGDAVIVFSRKAVFQHKKMIETALGTRVSVVYGSLPPETRSLQAKKFNRVGEDEEGTEDGESPAENSSKNRPFEASTPSHRSGSSSTSSKSIPDHKILVATDAIGLGLNLNIRRVIFSSLRKFDGVEMRDLRAPEVRQIGGRAGRYGSLYPTGEVTSIHPHGIAFLNQSFQAPVVPHVRAGLFPTFEHIQLFEHALSQYISEADASQNHPIGDAMLKHAERQGKKQKKISSRSKGGKDAMAAKEDAILRGTFASHVDPSNRHGTSSSLKPIDRKELEQIIIEEMKRRGRIPKAMKKLSEISTLGNSALQPLSNAASPQSSTPPLPQHHLSHGLLDHLNQGEVGTNEHDLLLSDPHLFAPHHLPSHHRHPSSTGIGVLGASNTASTQDNSSLSIPTSQAFIASKSKSIHTPTTLESIKLGDILEVYEETANLSGHFFLCRSDDHKKLAHAIDHLPLTLREKYTFVLAPVNAEDALLVSYLTRFATLFSKGCDVPCPSIPSMAELASSLEQADSSRVQTRGPTEKFAGWDKVEATLFQSLTTHPTPSKSPSRTSDPLKSHGNTAAESLTRPPTASKISPPSTEASHSLQLPIRRWEQLYKVIELYLWLSYRFEGFVEIEEALFTKLEIETQIAALLDFLPPPVVSKEMRRRRRTGGEKKLMRPYSEEEDWFGDELPERPWIEKHGVDGRKFTRRRGGVGSVRVAGGKSKGKWPGDALDLDLAPSIRAHSNKKKKAKTEMPFFHEYDGLEGAEDGNLLMDPYALARDLNASQYNKGLSSSVRKKNKKVVGRKSGTLASRKKL